MTLYIRMLFILLMGRFRRQEDPLEPAVNRFRVWPSDLDLFGHMTNSRYFAFMDVGRTDLIGRCGLVGELRSRGWYPVVVEESIQFRHSLNPFQKFELKTQITGYDERHIVMRQTFLVGGEVAALGVVRGRFLGPKGERVSPQQLLEVAGNRTAPAAVAFSEDEQRSYVYHKRLIDEESAV
jgi:acyl-CoA thioesterase FadM